MQSPKSLRCGLLLGALLIIAPGRSAAQWDVDGSIEMGADRRQNIFKSPASLAVNGESLPSDSLIQSDMIFVGEWDFKLAREFGEHELFVATNSELNRYTQFAYLNGADHEVEFGYEGKLSRRFTLETTIEGRRSRSVSTSVLGDELTRLFEYAQIEADGELTWQLSKNQALVLDYERRWRDYAKTPGEPSIDYAHHAGQLGWTVEGTKARRDPWALDVEIGYRYKNYRIYRARDASGEQDPAHPVSTFHYLDADIDYEWKLSRTVESSIELSGRRRIDPFEGYYSYNSGSVGLEFTWEPRRDLGFTADGKWRYVGYLMKSAPQAGSNSEEPALRYNYLDWELSVEHEIRRLLDVVAFVESNNRLSNVALETFRTRRSYGAMRMGLALKLDIDRMW